MSGIYAQLIVNFLDTRQTTIYTGDISNPEFRDFYAPVDGFVINGGVKLRFQEKVHTSKAF
jgi:hypothetical protein